MKLCVATMGPLDRAERQQLHVSPLVDGSVVIDPGEISDFAAARNLLLERARVAGYDWALVLDTDEAIDTSLTLRVPGELWAESDSYWGVLHDVLERTAYDVLMVPNIDGTYSKERIFRLPARGHYVGPTHEAFILDDGASRGELEGAWFTEEPKTHEQYRAKAERDEEILTRYLLEHEEDPRWWYYLGDTKAGLGDWEGAASAFERCYIRDGWDEEGAWAAFRIASIYSERQDWNAAILWCAKGMERRADFPELPWLAGWCCYQQGKYQQAIAWSRLAIAHGAVALSAAMRPPVTRVIFRHPPAHYEAPYDVIRWSLRQLGEDPTPYETTFEDRLARRQKSERRNARSPL